MRSWLIQLDLHARRVPCDINVTHQPRFGYFDWTWSAKSDEDFLGEDSSGDGWIDDYGEAFRNEPFVDFRSTYSLRIHTNLELRIVLNGEVADLSCVAPEGVSNNGVGMAELEKFGDREIGEDVDQNLNWKPSQRILRLIRHFCSNLLDSTKINTARVAGIPTLAFVERRIARVKGDKLSIAQAHTKVTIKSRTIIRCTVMLFGK